MENENVSPPTAPSSAEAESDRRYVHVDGRVKIELDPDGDPKNERRVKFTFLRDDLSPIDDQILFFYLDKPIVFRNVHLIGEFVLDGFNDSRSTLINAGLISSDEQFTDLEKSSNARGMNPSGKPPPPPRLS